MINNGPPPKFHGTRDNLWWRVARWLRRLHRWGWKDFRRRFTNPACASRLRRRTCADAATAGHLRAAAGGRCRPTSITWAGSSLEPARAGVAPPSTPSSQPPGLPTAPRPTQPRMERQQHPHPLGPGRGAGIAPGPFPRGGRRAHPSPGWTRAPAVSVGSLADWEHFSVELLGMQYGEKTRDGLSVNSPYRREASAGSSRRAPTTTVVAGDTVSSMARLAPSSEPLIHPPSSTGGATTQKQRSGRGQHLASPLPSEPAVRPTA